MILYLFFYSPFSLLFDLFMGYKFLSNNWYPRIKKKERKKEGKKKEREFSIYMYGWEMFLVFY